MQEELQEVLDDPSATPADVQHDPTPCDTTYECPRTPADQPGVTPVFLIGVLIPVLLVCLLAWLTRRP